MFVPACTARMHIEGLWCVSVSEPSKRRAATEHSSSSRECVSVCEHMCEGCRGEEKQTPWDSWERERKFGSRPNLSSTSGEPGPKDEARSVAQPEASGGDGVLGISFFL